MPRQKRRKRIAITIPDDQKDQNVFSTLQFEALPNEVILHVFSYLKIVDLVKCGQVSKRFRAISNDDQYLWPKKVNLCGKRVPVGFLQKLLDNGCEYLSLYHTILVDNLNLHVLDGLSFFDTLNSSKASKLKYLNLSGFGRCNRKNSIKLLESCYSLKKLSMSKFHLSSKLINSISLQNGKTLRVLDLSHCTFCADEKNCTYLELPLSTSSCDVPGAIKQIVENCTELRELSLYKTKLCETSIDILVSTLTSKIEKLDLFKMSFLKDKHVKTLVTRCNKITELNLAYETSITRWSLNFIIEHLQSTLVKLNLEDSNLNLNSSDLFKLKSMEKMKCLFYDREEWNFVDCRWLKKYLPEHTLRRNSLFLDEKSLTENSLDWIASPWYNHHQGFWEIKGERNEKFNTFFIDTENLVC